MVPYIKIAWVVLGIVTVGVWSASAEENEVGPWWKWNEVTGDWAGKRPAFQERGVELFGSYTAEVWGNPTGGADQGTVYTGLIEFGAEIDFEDLIGWKGASFSTTWLWLSGKDISSEYIGNYFTVSNIAGFQTLRMYEMWFQQNFMEDAISLRLGQLSADSEFVISDYSGLFLNGTFGWPAFVYTNLPAGGPGFPMGTLGVRLALQPAEWFTFLSAVFQGNVYDQNVNRHGFRWDLDAENGFLFLNEAQFRWSKAALPGSAKAGMWAQTGQMADVLAESTTSGNYGYYFIVDQMLFREPSPELPAPTGKSKNTGKSFKEPVAVETQDSFQGLGWFGRLAFTDPDRNFLDFYFDTGLTYTGLIPTRDNDSLGIGFAYGQVGSTAGGQLLSEGARGIGAEMVLEFTYQAQITPWMVVQPDIQYIINPGGTRDYGNALVIGGRLTVAF